MHQVAALGGVITVGLPTPIAAGRCGARTSIWPFSLVRKHGVRDEAVDEQQSQKDKRWDYTEERDVGRQGERGILFDRGGDL